MTKFNNAHHFLSSSDSSASLTSSLQNIRHTLSEIKGQSQAMDRVLQTVGKVARSDSPVLINGESGTGKELIARAIHRLSQRVSRRFVAINCSAIPENLLESELFGHVKGAFTGAESRRKGYFEEAHGGTIFLDEIGDMPWRLQAKLLRVLQEKQFSPIGSNETKFADVRVVAATNVNLEKAVADKDFRLDLFYRLNVLPVRVPALHERKEDISVLLNHFLEESNKQHNFMNPAYFQPEVYQVLQNHRWPGNVRELQNLVERLVVITGGGRIAVDDLPPEYRHGKIDEPKVTKTLESQIQQDPVSSVDKAAPEGDLPELGINLTEYIEQLENSLILQALERTGNNKNRAAKLLGLNRTTLVERIKKRKLAPLNSPSREL
ncbi:sigma-54 interaction domain-containing protein [Pseudobacteriovorax antillogorgiicola]|nr:sigma 54-interacting transcriptional regulator [Pseudobacteriovorax antillogorgiicola]